MKAFLRYITRPSGFGRTQWSFWICMVAVMLYGAALVVIDFDPTTAIAVGSCFALTTGIVAWGTIKNFREDQRDLSNPKHHMNDVSGEGREFPTMKNPTGSPITDPIIWYRARYQVSEERAKLDSQVPEHWYQIVKEHQHYLADKRFDKFLRK